VFLHLRDDIEPTQCVLEPGQIESVELSPETAGDVSAVTEASNHPRFVPTNVDKVFWPADGFTKGDLIAYYQAIEPTLMPYLKDRPLVLKRYPGGVTGEYFYQKDAPAHRPDWVRTEAIRSDETKRQIHYFVGCDRDLLPYLANLGGVTQNPWSSRVGRLDHPDYVIFDLDPVSGTPYRSVQKVALELRKVLEELELRSYPKTSGASGIHVYLPLLEDRFTYREVRSFAEAIARVVVDRVGELATIERVVGRRPKASVYIDYLQNATGQTVASVYSPRARAGAPVSTPLRWDELRRAIDPVKYNIRTIFRRLRRVGDLFGPVLEDRQDISQFLAALKGRK
jgi:bifunctional non-homologous end joining protein LigD